jgi:hypothetical protein
VQYASINDALAILRDIVGLDNNATVVTHDFNGNGELDLEDALLVLRGLVGIGEQQVLWVVAHRFQRTDEILQGEEISFNVRGISGSFRGSDAEKIFGNVRGSALVIRSLQGLSTLQNYIPVRFDDYDYDFFNENALIVVPAPYLSSSFEMEIKSLTKNVNELHINATQYFIWWGVCSCGGNARRCCVGDARLIVLETDDVNFRYFLIEVNNNLADVTHFSFSEMFFPCPQQLEWKRENDMESYNATVLWLQKNEGGYIR